MINKIRSNLKLYNVLFKALLVLTYFFASWKEFAGTLTLMQNSADWPTIVWGCAISSAVMVAIAHFLPRIYLKFAKIYTVNLQEYSVIATLFFALHYLIVGLLNLLLLAFPSFITWGSVLFPLVSVLGCGVAFYFATCKLYFNDVTRYYYFNSLSILIIVMAVLEGGVI